MGDTTFVYLARFPLSVPSGSIKTKRSSVWEPGKEATRGREGERNDERSQSKSHLLRQPQRGNSDLGRWSGASDTGLQPRVLVGKRALWVLTATHHQHASLAGLWAPWPAMRSPCVLPVTSTAAQAFPGSLHQLGPNPTMSG